MGENYKSGLPTVAHDKMDVRAYFSLVDEAVCRHRGGLIADLFCGGGRDIAFFHSLLKGEGRFVGIDADPKRIRDALLKKDEKGAPLFVKVSNRTALETAFSRKKIAALRGTLPDTPFGKTNIDLKEKVDVLLCNAGIMFLTDAEMKKTLPLFAAMLAPKGEMFLRFSQERADKAGDPGHHIHNPALISDLLMQEGLKVTRNPDLPDPDKRGFSLVDLHCYKIG
jgi:SAM-dependent methyltransferase